MSTENTRRGFTQIIFGKNILFTSPLEGEDVRRTKEGDEINRVAPLPASGHPLPQGARKTTRGFTLIELLVVVLIIGILAAVALPQYQQAVARNQLATLKQLTQSIVSAEEIYYLAKGEYSDNFSELILAMPENKKSDSTSNWYRYSWGRCFTGKGNFARACCYHNKAHLGYCVFFPHHPSIPNRRTCMVLDTTDTTHWRNLICKVETKANSGTASSGDNLIQWVYQNN